MLHEITNQFHSNLRMGAWNKGHEKQVTIIAASFSIAFILLAVLLSGYFRIGKLVKKRRVKRQLGRLADISSQTHLSFKYETLEKATNYFNPSNKLGQGGAGTVFKGVLRNGSRVAVKRLFFNTRQWMDHFYNEVNLLSGINHKNLVKLLGCSINGPESLLVYEYLPNRSLHYYLSGDGKHKLLDWKTRFNIIFGAAEGLAYLHEESQLRIIHRDVKLSNILLAEDFTAKIADFGLARLHPQDKTHLSTGVAGTLGYMAPEYFLNGKLTEKVDVFSFGVVIIEVMTGRRNITGGQDPFSPLQMVWNFYKTNRILDALDPVLYGEVSPDKMARVLNIGLLCAQASPEPRPSMSLVVKMLKGDHIPPPTEPPFLSNNAEITSHAAKNCEHQSPTQSPKNNLEMEIEMEPS